MNRLINKTLMKLQKLTKKKCLLCVQYIIQPTHLRRDKVTGLFNVGIFKIFQKFSTPYKVNTNKQTKKNRNTHPNSSLD